MNSQEFLILNVSWVSLFLFWCWKSWGGASKKPTVLNMHAPDSAPLVMPPEASSAPAVASVVAPAMRQAAKNLNVIFNYNGHSWDAYEVLGIPAGSQIKDVTMAYQAALKTSDAASHGFLETAYKSILHRL